MPTGCESPRACESRTNVGAGRSPFHVQETMPPARARRIKAEYARRRWNKKHKRRTAWRQLQLALQCIPVQAQTPQAQRVSCQRYDMVNSFVLVSLERF